MYIVALHSTSCMHSGDKQKEQEPTSESNMC